MEVNKKQLADIFGASIRTIQNWQEQGMPVHRRAACTGKRGHRG
ncbi:terminase small subunit [Escherichia coli]|nr:terminase small subunit [Escherichia coli]EFE6063085.1 terminase small subunit [Escherichia coli]EFE6078974.1 terminase small subunit [Escherichia coli]EFE9612445.1 terminase small subunit [Escherichia coli]EFE9617316.1 terminase small subunit [Escherichia coli]